jgi:hypothetical protein
VEDYEHPATASLDEYLHSSYDPDVDFVDGQLLDRLWGEFPHSAVRTEALFVLHEACKPLGDEGSAEHSNSRIANAHKGRGCCDAEASLEENPNRRRGSGALRRGS